MSREHLREELFIKQNGKCEICGCDLQIDIHRCHDNDYLQIDHILPISLGGSGSKSNLRGLCRKCNIGRSNRAGEYLKDSIVDRNEAASISENDKNRLIDNLKHGLLDVNDLNEMYVSLHNLYEKNLNVLLMMMNYYKSPKNQGGD